MFHPTTLKNKNEVLSHWQLSNICDEITRKNFVWAVQNVSDFKFSCIFLCKLKN